MTGKQLGALVAVATIATAGLSLGHSAHAEDTSPSGGMMRGESDPLFDDDFGGELDPAAFPDPLEKANRSFLRFNLELDRWLLDPVTRGYRFIMPDPLERALGRFFDNLNGPPTIANDLIQLEWKDAGVATGRFVLNSTLGLAGFLDVASPMGLESHSSDFGQTLALAGLPSGPYLVLPVLGPSTVRDGAGVIVDTFLDPTSYVIPLVGPERLFYGGSSGLSVRAQHFESLKALEESSVDFYSTLRSAWSQNRAHEIWDRRESRRPAAD